MELSRRELGLILDALFAQIVDDDMTPDKALQVRVLHNKIGLELYPNARDIRIPGIDGDDNN